MSWDPPEPAIEPNVEHLKTVCTWKKDLSGPLHACAGAWIPGQWSWTMRGNETYCGVWLPRTTDVASLWDTSVTLIKDIDCSECLANLAADKLGKSWL